MACKVGADRGIGLVDGVGGIVESLPEGLVFGAGLAVVDVLHGVQAETVHAHLEPLLHAHHNGLERGGRGAGRSRAVIEVHEHACAELSIIIVELAAGHHNRLDVVRVVVGIEGVGHSELHLVAGGAEAPLGLSGPDILLGGTHQAAPGALVIEHEDVLVVAGIGKLRISAAAPIEIALRVVVGAAVARGRLGSLRDRHLRGRRIGPVKLDLVTVLAASADGNRVPLVFVVSVGRRHLGNLAGLDVGLRVLREGEVVPVGAVGAVVLHVEEPLVLVAGVIDNVIHVDADIVQVGLMDELLEIRLGAEARVHGLVVGDIVAVIALCGLDGREPEGGHAKGVEVVEALGKALEVAITVAVGILETEHVHLIGKAGSLLCGLQGAAASAGAVVRLALVLMGPGASCGQDVGNLVLHTEIDVPLSAACHGDVGTTGDQFQLGVRRSGAGILAKVLSVAEIDVPFAVLAELELLAGGDGHISGHLPVTFRIHGEVEIP